jgi:methoxymalonate biosynthesis acyl carrier protein
MRTFLAGRLGMADLDPELDIFAAGLMSSLLAVELVAHIEGTYGIELAAVDLAPENFVSVRAMARLVDGKRAAHHVAP